MKSFLIFLFILSLGWQAGAQHDHHNHNEPKKAPVKKETKPKTKLAPKGNKPAPSKDSTAQDTSSIDDSGQEGHIGMETDSSMHNHMNMYSAFSRNLPMSRNGSGTSWQPDNYICVSI